MVLRTRLILANRTKREFDEAVGYYGSLDTDISRAFRDVTKKLLLAISEYPLRWSLVSKRVRRCLYPRRFPYAIYYQVRTDHILVLSIWHTCRRPESWQNRVPKK